MSEELLYNPFEDKDVAVPAYKKNGKRLVVPTFVSGMKIKEITSRNGESLVLVELEFEIHKTIEKLGTVTVFEEDENNRYNYRAPKPDEEAIDASILEGKRIKSGKRVSLWQNKTKASGKMNRIYIETLKSFGIELEEKEVKQNGKKIKTVVVPEPTEELLLGIPLFAWLGEDGFTTKNGDEVRYTAVDKVQRIPDQERIEVIENSMKQSEKGGSKIESDPFGDDIDDDEDLPF